MTGPNLDQSPSESDGQPEDVNLKPVPLESGELPSSYGANRLVLLPVDPYLIHVYWDLDSTVPPAAGVRPILRFYESAVSEAVPQSRPFDVDIDFSTSSWYVNLWSPNKIYYADLGWRGEDGAFIQLARSNTVLTPPAWPRPADPVEAPTQVPAPVVAVTPIEVVPVEADPEKQPLPPEPPPPEPRNSAAPPRSHANEFLNRRLAELFAIRGELPPVHEPVELPYEFAEDIPGEPSQLDAPTPSPWNGYENLDLTQLSEERFTPGISSEWNSLGE